MRRAFTQTTLKAFVWSYRREKILSIVKIAGSREQESPETKLQSPIWTHGKEIYGNSTARARKRERIICCRSLAFNNLKEMFVPCKSQSTVEESFYKTFTTFLHSQFTFTRRMYQWWILVSLEWARRLSPNLLGFLFAAAFSDNTKQPQKVFVFIMCIWAREGRSVETGRKIVFHLFVHL